MEVRDPIHGTIELSPIEAAICSTQCFQRLRHIKQLGFSEISFPGATHNRFIHSLGVTHLSGLAFEQLFKDEHKLPVKDHIRLKQALKLGALLHDVGHGPLSHTTEEVMPSLESLKLEVYKKSPIHTQNMDRQANHEDYTIKFVTDSEISKVIEELGEGIEPYHIACLIDKTLKDEDGFYIHEGVNYRPVLSQIVSSEMDVDRMDYLLRDAYFCGTRYGQIEWSWLMANFRIHVEHQSAYLGLNTKALYTFDDFLLSRHHMHLMVYFHHKAVIYEEMLIRYLRSDDCTYKLPSHLDEYIHCTDLSLMNHLRHEKNQWSQRVYHKTAYKVLYEKHSMGQDDLLGKMKVFLEARDIDVIHANSTARLSRYHGASEIDRSFPIYVIDASEFGEKAQRIEEATKIFDRYHDIRHIDRLYVSPENWSKAKEVLKSFSV